MEIVVEVGLSGKEKCFSTVVLARDYLHCNLLYIKNESILPYVQCKAQSREVT